MWPEGQVWKPGPAYPASGKSTSLSSTDPTPSVSGPERAMHTSPRHRPANRILKYRCVLTEHHIGWALSHGTPLGLRAWPCVGHWGLSFLFRVKEDRGKKQAPGGAPHGPSTRCPTSQPASPPTRQPAPFPSSLFRPNDDLYPPVFLLSSHVARGHKKLSFSPSPRIQARGLESE